MALFKKGIYKIDDKILKVQNLLIEKIKIYKFHFEVQLIKRIVEINNQPLSISIIYNQKKIFLSQIMNDSSTVINIDLLVNLKVVTKQLDIHKKTLLSWIEESKRHTIISDLSRFGINEVYLKSNNYQNNYDKVFIEKDSEMIDLFKLYILLIYKKNKNF